EAEKSAGKMQFIKSPLNRVEIEAVALILKTLEKNMEKSGFFANIANFTSLNQLKKILKLKEFDVKFETLNRLKSELEFAEMNYRLQKIENDIQKTGNLHVLTEQIRQMKKKQGTLAKNILKNKRREALKA